MTKQNKEKISKIKSAVTGAVVGTLMVPIFGILAHNLNSGWRENGQNAYFNQDLSLKKRFEVAYNPKLNRHATENTYTILYIRYGNAIDAGEKTHAYAGPALIYTLHGLFLLAGALVAVNATTAERKLKKMLEQQKVK